MQNATGCSLSPTFRSEGAKMQTQVPEAIYPKLRKLQPQRPSLVWVPSKALQCAHTFLFCKICRAKSLSIFKRRIPINFCINLRLHKTWICPWRPLTHVYIFRNLFKEEKNIKKTLNITDMFRTCFYLIIIITIINSFL